MDTVKASVIDLGFNSLKMVNYNVSPEGSLRAYSQLGFKVKLGEGLNETGFLGDEPVRRTLEKLRVFRDVVEMEGIKQVIPVATSAVREAANRDQFVDEAFAATGFRFRVLTAKEEAFFSYAGAASLAGLDDSVFFDLGGGSVEIVRTEKGRITSVLSLPLGALRLTYSYGKRDGTFNQQGLRDMKARIGALLPSRRDLHIGPGTALVGVGGTVRALARYDQDLRGYPFNKMHNYSMSYPSVDSSARELVSMSERELSKVNALGNRTETITAGAWVIKLIMKKMHFRSVRVSTHGLREGTLSLYLQNQRDFHSGSVSQAGVEALVRRSSPKVGSDNVITFVNARLIDAREGALIQEACRLVGQVEPTVELQSLFFELLGEDSPLGHTEQVDASLLVVNTRNQKAAEFLLDEYKRVAGGMKKKQLKRLSSVFALVETADRCGARLRVRARGRSFAISVTGSEGKVPTSLMKVHVEQIAETFGRDASFRESERLGRAGREPYIRGGISD